MAPPPSGEAAAAGLSAKDGAVPSPSPLATTLTFERRVQFLAVGFLVLFVAYSSAQLLQTAVNRQYGYICLLSLYAVFGVTALFAPEVVGRVGPRRLLAMSAVGYVVMVAANLNPIPGLLIPGCIIVGASAATLWASQGTYIGACAVQLSQRSGRPLTECTSQLNASFYSIFMTSGGISNIFASLIMMSGAPDAIRVLFLVLTVVGCAGVVLLASLPASDDPSAAFLAAPWFVTEFTAWRAGKRGGAGAGASGGALSASASGPGSGGGSGSGEAGGRMADSILGAGPADAEGNVGDKWADLPHKEGEDHAATTAAVTAAAALPAAVAAADDVIERSRSSAVRRRNTGPDGEQAAQPATAQPGAEAGGDGGSVSADSSASPQAGASSSSSSSSLASSSSPSLAKPSRPSLLFMLRFLFTNRKMRFLVPTMFLTGAGGGFVSGAWNGGVVARVLGAEYVGFVGATYSLSAAAATRVWGKLAQRKQFGRRWAFVCAYCAHIAWFLAWFAWSRANLVDADEADTGAGAAVGGAGPDSSSPSSSPSFPLPPGPERNAAFAVVFLGAFWFASFDPVFNSLIPATLQTFFPSGAEAPCAMASIRAVYSVGFSAQQGISIALGGKHVAAQAGGLLCFAVFAASCMRYLHANVAAIDGGPQQQPPPAPGGAKGEAEAETDGGESGGKAPSLRGGLTLDDWGEGKAQKEGV